LSLNAGFLTKKKILFFHDNYSTPGGASKYCKNICKLLGNKGAKIYLFTYSQSLDEEGKKNFCYKHKRKKNKIIRHFEHFYINISLLVSLRQWIHHIKPDLIYINHNYSFSSTVLLAISSKIPTIQIIHDYRFFCPGSGQKITPDGVDCESKPGINCYRLGCISIFHYIKEFAPNLLLRLLYKRKIDCFIAPSENLNKCLESWNLKAMHLPLFTDLQDSFPHPTKIGSNRVLFVGILYGIKGVDVLLEAFVKVCSEISSARLDIVGSGPELENLKQKTDSLKLGGHVTFHGLVAYENIASYYQQASLVAIPSIISENSPLVIYEAMAAARPVVASRVQGNIELVVEKENGLLFQRGNAEHLAQQILYMLTNESEACRMGKVGRKMLKKNFMVDNHLLGLNKLIQSLVSGRA